MRKPLPSRGPLVFVAACLACLLTPTLSGQGLKSFELPSQGAKPPVVSGQETKPSTASGQNLLKSLKGSGQNVQSNTTRVPLVQDWSSHHAFFSKPANAQQAAKAQQEPRYLLQNLLQNRISPPSRNKAPGIFGRGFFNRQQVRSDWAVSLGAGGVAQGMYPAKYTFDVNAFPSCSADFAVFPINASTGSSRASVTGTFNAPPVSGDTFSITTTPTGATLTLTASAINTGQNFQISPIISVDASRLAAAINRNLSASIPDRIVAVASGNTVTVYALTAGSGETLTDGTNSGEFSWGAINPGQDATQANIVAFNELYSGSAAKCAPQPAFIFSYASGVGPIATSPTLSLDGTKIAYVENDPFIGAILHVLTYGTGSTEFGVCITGNGGAFPPDCATNPVIPGSTPGSTATDAMLPLGLLTVNAATGAAGASDTFSSPFIHYGFDTTYVGDDNGYLYSIYPTFTATPAHAGGSFFPVSLIAPAASETPTAVTAVHSTGVVTVTVSSTTGLGIGELVTIAGVAPHGTQCSAPVAAEINGTWTIASIPSGTKFTFVTTITTSTSAPGCTVTGATVTPGTSYVSAPSLDGNITDNIFVGDSSGNLYMVSGAGVVQATLSVGSAANGGVRNGPIVDSTNSVGYAVTACSGGDSALTQFTFTTTTMVKTASAGLDTSGAGCTVPGIPTYDPAPDGRYYHLGIGNATAANNGEIIAAASTTGGQQISTFQFASSAMQTPAEATREIGSNPSVISPLTEFFNNTFITSSMTSVTATRGNPGVVTVMAHNTLSPGDVVLISGIAADADCDAADVAGINGMPTVASANATQFTFNATIPDMTNGPCDHFGSAVGGPDYMFMGVAQNSTELFSFLLPSGTVSGTPAPVTNITDVAGGTSGIVIDNNDAVDGQTASLYYGTLAASDSICGGGNFCAIKLTQGGLQ